MIVTLGKADERDFIFAREFFSVLPQRTTILWNDGPRIRSLYDILTKNEISAGGGRELAKDFLERVYKREEKEERGKQKISHI